MTQPVHERSDSDAAQDASAAPPNVRRHRISHSRLAMPLPPYDIRVRRELAHRRTILAMLRHLQRIVFLHVLDAAAALGAGLVALRLVPIPANRSILPLLVGFVLVGLDG